MDNIWLSYDPGSGHEAGIALWGYTPSGELKLWHYWEPQKQTMQTEAEMVIDALGGRWLEGVVFDPAAKQTQKRLDNLTCQMDLMMDALKGYGYSYESGLIKQGPIASSTDEIQATNRVEAGIRQVRQFLDEGRLVVPRSTESGGRTFIQRMQSYRFKEGTIERGIGKVVKKKDEGPDLLRYMVRWIYANRIRYMNRGPNYPRKHDKGDLVVSPDEIRRLRSKQIAMNAERENARKRRAKRRNR